MPKSKNKDLVKAFSKWYKKSAPFRYPDKMIGLSIEKID